MMERFTADARQVVARAREEADLLQHGFIGCEHLLLALSGSKGTPAADALAAFGLKTAALRQRVAELVGRGTELRQEMDAGALASLGIDLDEVRRATEASFGPGALERARSGRQRPGWAASRRWTPRAKKSLELALRIAVKRRDREITAGHLLLGVLSQGNNAALRVLREEGVATDALRDELTRRMATAA